MTTAEIVQPLPPGATARPERGFSWVLVTTILGGLSLAPWMFVMVKSAFAYDSGGSTMLSITVFVLGTYAPVMVLAVIAGWICDAMRRRRLSLALALLPLAYVVVVIPGVFLVGAGV